MGDADFIFITTCVHLIWFCHPLPATTAPAGAMVMMNPLIVKLDMIPAEIDKIVFVVTIHDAQTRRQSFGRYPAHLSARSVMIPILKSPVMT